MCNRQWRDEFRWNCRWAILGLLSLAICVASGGCALGPQLVPESNRHPIDRKLVECPKGWVLKTAVRGLSAPSSIVLVTEEGEYKGSMLVAESGDDLNSPRIFGWKADGTFFNVYPRGRQIRIPSFGLIPKSYDIEGPIGGMTMGPQGRIYVTHRDHRGVGVVSAFGFDGSTETIFAGLPARGDYGITDIVYNPRQGRLYVGVGAATNSGIVGLDNWQVGWVKQNPDFCDRPNSALRLRGSKFFTKNPIAGLFSGEDNVGTAPFQLFGKNDQLRVSKAPNDKPTSAIYWVSPSGGDWGVFAHGIRYPRGLAFDQFGQGNLYATDDGMELRGSRPVKDDPDSLLAIKQNTWYGWPDFTTTLRPIDRDEYMDKDMLRRTGYPELAFLIDHAASDLISPTERSETLVAAEFKPLSGAAKLDIIPGNVGLPEGQAVVALSGDRGPFATSGRKLNAPTGFKVVLAHIDAPKHVEEFIKNTDGVPASAIGGEIEALERPIDVKFGPDGKLYIVDYGKMEMRGGRERITAGSGRIFVLERVAAGTPTTQP